MSGKICGLDHSPAAVQSETAKHGDANAEVTLVTKFDSPTATVDRYEQSRPRSDSCSSTIDELLFEIYDRWQYDHWHYRDSLDSDTFTECSSTSDAVHGRADSIQLDFRQKHSNRPNRAYLESKSVCELEAMRVQLQHHVTQMSCRLIRQLKSRERAMARIRKKCDIITAVLQASSLKRRVDSKLKFSIAPQCGDDAFQQWRDAMRAVAKLPMGIPAELRKKVWLALAEDHVSKLRLDWQNTKKFAFNERSNPDDNKLGMQIVKDLHRTGCRGFNGEDNESDRAALKRVLLAYARWNKKVGYCQGFNILAALILQVVDRNEEDALKLMIFLVDEVLPESYFANNLRALSVDMAVFRDLLQIQLPRLSRHLDYLQSAARDDSSGASYEPPLTNVFTMQWFLTLFATCLPKETALRVWDCILLDSADVLLRTALAIWAKLHSRILRVHSADEFYTTMAKISQDMLDTRIIDADQLIKNLYSMAPMAFERLSELREKYTYNITPLCGTIKGQPRVPTGVFSDDDEIDEDDIAANMNCFGSMFPGQLSSPRGSRTIGQLENGGGGGFDISQTSPGAYGSGTEPVPSSGTLAYSERMSLDIGKLCKQYKKLRQRQQQAHVILAAASAKHHANMKARSKVVAPIESPVAVNHLFLRHAPDSKQRNASVAHAPRIAPLYPASNVLNTQLGVNAARGTSGGKSQNRHRKMREGNLTGNVDAGNATSPQCDLETSHKIAEAHGGIVVDETTEKLATGMVVEDEQVEEEPVSIAQACHSQGRTAGATTRTLTRGSSIDSDVSNTSPCVDSNSQGSSTASTIDGSDTDSESGCVRVNPSASTAETSSQLSTTPSGDDRVAIVEASVRMTRSFASTPTRRKNIQEVDVSPTTVSGDAARPTLLEVAQGRNTAVAVEEDQTPEQPTAPAVEPTTPDNCNASASTVNRPFNPFPRQPINRHRCENGIRLGLYREQATTAEENGRAGACSIGRAQINACLHRQYMARVKRQTERTNR